MLARCDPGSAERLLDDSIAGSRIIAVCDAFDAMTSTRSYRQPMGMDVALEELKRHAGTQLDAAVVEAFCTVLLAHRSPDEKSHVSVVNG